MKRIAIHFAGIPCGALHAGLPTTDDRNAITCLNCRRAMQPPPEPASKTSPLGGVLSDADKGTLSQKARAAQQAIAYSSDPVHIGALALYFKSVRPDVVLALLHEGEAMNERLHYAERALADIRALLKDQSEGRNHVLEVDIPSLIDSIIGPEPPNWASFANEPGLDELPF